MCDKWPFIAHGSVVVSAVMDIQWLKPLAPTTGVWMNPPLNKMKISSFKEVNDIQFTI